MAVTSVAELADERRFESDGLGRTYWRSYLVTLAAADYADGPGAAAVADDGTTAVPAFGGYYSAGATEDVYAYLRNKTVSQYGDTKNVFKVVCTFSTKSDFRGMWVGGWSNVVPGQTGPVFIDNPLLRPTTLSFSQQKMERVLDWYYDETTDPLHPAWKPVLNSAGQPFDPPIVYYETINVVRFTRNYQTFSFDTVIAYQDCVNKNTFYTADPGQALMVSITPQPMFECGMWFVNVTYEVHFTWGLYGWDRRQVDTGTRYVDGDGKWWVSADPTGMAFGEPCLLNGAGVPLTFAQIAAGQAFARTYPLYRRRNFDELNIFYP